MVPARYILAVLGSIAMAIVYGLKVNLSVAMVGMLNHTGIKAMGPDEDNVTRGGEECTVEGASNTTVSKFKLFYYITVT